MREGSGKRWVQLRWAFIEFCRATAVFLRSGSQDDGTRPNRSGPPHRLIPGPRASPDGFTGETANAQETQEARGSDWRKARPPVRLFLQLANNRAQLTESRCLITIMRLRCSRRLRARAA
ncbi:hypothetical protein MHYP_G00231950 [Metynnis hypsauchen]